MQIRQLDISSVPDSGVNVFIGRRKSGKTVNILDFLYHKRRSFAYGIVFCGSKATVQAYEKCIPSTYIYDSFDSDLLKRFFDKQERDVELGTAKPVFVLLDDLMFDKSCVLKDKTVRRIFMNGRHAKVCLMMSLQYSMDLHPSMRQQIDYIFLSREKNPHYREKLYHNYNVCFRTASDFDRTMQACTQNFETFVLSSCSDTQSDAPEDNVFWHKSKLGRTFQVGSRRWWLFHRRRFNPKHFLGGSNRACVPLACVEKLPLTTTCASPAPSLASTPQGQEWLEEQRRQNRGGRRGIGGVRTVDTATRMVV
jgi:hypothetical protein